MSNVDTLVKALNTGANDRELVNVKFFVGKEATSEGVCLEAIKAATQMGSGEIEPKTTIDRNFETVSINRFI